MRKVSAVKFSYLFTLSMMMSLPVAAQGDDYLTQPAGEGVRNSAGECWRTGAWESESEHEDCNPAPAEQAAMEPEEVVVSEPAPVPKKVVQRINLQSDANFSFDRAQLTEQGKAALADLAQAVRGSQEPELSIVGHADKIGSESYNYDLSARRAQAVQQYLLSLGVPAEIITLEAKGELQPKVHCDQLHGQALIECLAPNRRTEVEFSAFEVSQTPE